MMNERLLEKCIEKCWRCRHECQTALYGMCLTEQGSHVEKTHVKVMADCIQICQTSADFMSRRSAYHVSVCQACADVCEACAASCKALGMDDCARHCQECAIICRQMTHETGRKAA